ncbi:hypothetical protein C1646_778485 [Rhizophagus diaphanus]|nr:hypothetical protein C1646_778485 [Rhizophagus diaphanus] [Rhizophagus sp. MUCL 43196]
MQQYPTFKLFQFVRQDDKINVSSKNISKQKEFCLSRINPSKIEWNVYKNSASKNGSTDDGNSSVTF